MLCTRTLPPFGRVGYRVLHGNCKGRDRPIHKYDKVVDISTFGITETRYDVHIKMKIASALCTNARCL